MDCCNYGTLPLSPEKCNFETVNDQVKRSLNALSGNTRKAIKLLEKQYVIESIEITDDYVEKQNDRIVRKEKGEVKITYLNPHTPQIKFIWVIEEKDIKK